LTSTLIWYSKYLHYFYNPGSAECCLRIIKISLWQDNYLLINGLFLCSLSIPQFPAFPLIQLRKAFLGLAKKILIADDGTIDNEEEDYLRNICAEMSLSTTDEVVVTNNTLSELFPSISEKKVVLLELVALAYSNGEYHKNEKTFIEDIILKLKLDISILSDLEENVSSFFKIQKKLLSFITEE